MSQLLMNLLSGQVYREEVKTEGGDTGGGEGSAVESATPEAPAEPAVLEGEQPSELDLSDMMGEEGDEPTEPKVDDAPKPSEVKPTEAPVATTAPTPEQPVQPAPTPQPTTQEQPAPKLEELRKGEMDRLTKAYELSSEDAKTLAIEPEKVLPQIAARLHVEVFEATVNAVISHLPNIIENITQQRTARSAAEQTFYTEFPVLKDQKFRQQVEAGLQYYKHINPSATMEQAVAHVGVQVSLANQLSLPQKYLEQMGLVTRPADAGMQSNRPIPPASPGASRSEPAPGPTNYYAKIAEEELDD